VAAAIPTAYTGASGIFVIAAGAVIYKEVFASGARRQYALAATAMSGSLGVVLSPCLLIVVIAALNKEVTTSLCIAKVLKVFLLASTMFLIVSLIDFQRRL
jgi:TRAP-type C4-dicarboxylate transport system permease large subunit